MSNGAGGSKVPDPHPLIQSRDLEDTIRLHGYVGASEHPNHISLYWSLHDLRMFVDVPSNLIKGYEQPDETNAPTIVWVKSTAKLIYHCSLNLDGAGGFLTGSIARRYLPTARGNPPSAADTLYDTVSYFHKPDDGLNFALTPATPCHTPQIVEMMGCLITELWCVPPATAP